MKIHKRDLKVSRLISEAINIEMELDEKILLLLIHSPFLENTVNVLCFPIFKNFSFLCSNISFFVYCLNSSKYFIKTSLTEEIA